jgi:pimeloyl-ACP methyl ester carboxylesterase
VLSWLEFEAAGTLSHHVSEAPIPFAPLSDSLPFRHRSDARPSWFEAPSSHRAEDSPTFVLIHGVGLSHRSLSRLARSLREEGRVLAPDLPGFGVTPGPRRRLTIEDMADALLPRLEALTGGVVLVGHSLGAEVATDLARRRPDLVRGLVLVGPVVDPDASSLFGQWRRLAIDMWGEPPLTGAMVVRDYVRGGLFSFFAGVTSMLRYSTADQLSDVGSPVLVVRGAHDRVAPARWVGALAAAAPVGASSSVEGALHNGVHSHPTETAELIAAFARRVTSERP